MAPPATNLAGANFAPSRLIPPSAWLEDPLQTFAIACNTWNGVPVT